MKNATDFLKKPAIWLIMGGFLLAGCGGIDLSGLGNRLNPVPENSDDASLAPRPKPDSRGVVTYENYQIIVAQRGDTMSDIAQRVGMDTAELAQHNGLDVSYRPRGGEVLALPQGVIIPQEAPDGASSTDLEAIASSAIDDADGSQAGFIQPGPEPIRHTVEPGETAYTIARLYDVSVTSLASWNGLDRDLNVRVGQRLLIPVTADGVPQQQNTTQEVATSDPGTGSQTPEPPSASTPLPETTAVAEVPESPNLNENRTPPGASRKLLQPIAGSIIRGYDKAGGNEGIDIAANAGTSVRAAEDGEIALISGANGGNTILLIRHADNLYTVYSNIGDVSVIKGQSVRRGQSVARVANGASYLHFEIRRGTESVDPVPYL